MSPIDTAPIDAAAARSELIARALARATAAHAGQIRNGSGGLPYIEHPRMVAATLAARDYDEATLAAALLHDVVEDSDTTVEELRAEFGDEIADLVAALSDDESIESYRDRKDEHRRRVAAVDGDALAIYAADKLTNMITLDAAIEGEGMRVADEYKVPLTLKLEVWEADAAMLATTEPGLLLLDPLGEAITRLGADLEAAAPRP
jgi:GTP diphosphokinase / guanosine-3',5'-bis(diphosphate) 3'-diphosphatase